LLELYAYEIVIGGMIMASAQENNDAASRTLPGIIILTHGNLGEELIHSASMVFGKMENVWALSLKVGDDPDEYRVRLSKKLDDMPANSLVMVDLFGGTPSNSLMLLAKRRPVFALTGVNMPMLIEAANMRNSLSGKELLDAIVETGHQGIVNITELMNR